jgi:hypothetical protein
MFGFSLIAFFLSMWTNNTAVIIALLSITDALFELDFIAIRNQRTVEVDINNQRTVEDVNVLSANKQYEDVNTPASDIEDSNTPEPDDGVSEYQLYKG